MVHRVVFNIPPSRGRERLEESSCYGVMLGLVGYSTIAMYVCLDNSSMWQRTEEWHRGEVVQGGGGANFVRATAQ